LFTIINSNSKLIMRPQTSQSTSKSKLPASLLTEK